MAVLRSLIVAVFTIFLPIAVFVLVYFNTIGPDRIYPLPIALTIVTVLFGFMLFGLIVHEAAHAITARALGKQVNAFSILWVRCEFRDGARQVKRNPPHTPAGSVEIVGHEASPRGVRDYLFIVAAGPLAEVVYTALLFGAAFSIDGWLRYSFQLAGFWNGFLALGNIMPFKSGTDGSIFLSMVRWRDNAIDRIALSDWNGIIDGEADPRDWPQSIVEQKLACLYRPVQRVAWHVDAALISGFALYLHFADRGDWEAAERISQRMFVCAQQPLAGVNETLRTSILTINAIDLALRRSDSANATAVLRRVPRGSIVANDSLYVGAQAAIALAEGAYDAAIGLASTANAPADEESQRIGANRVQTRWWNEVIERATAANDARPMTPRPTTSPRFGYDVERAWNMPNA